MGDPVVATPSERCDHICLLPKDHHLTGSETHMHGYEHPSPRAELARLRALLDALPDSILAVAAALTVELPEGWQADFAATGRTYGIVVIDPEGASRGYVPRQPNGTWGYQDYPSAQAAVDAITGRSDPTTKGT